jgi:hypothetical protein
MRIQKDVGEEMKANQKETKLLSDSIDKMNEALEEVIELYNNIEEDIPVVKFDEDVLKNISKAKNVYGEDYVDKKINSIVQEVLSWLPLDKVNAARDEEEDMEKE